jgi:probable F420-dependent oxidoreductase
MSRALRFGVQIGGGGSAADWIETARVTEALGYSTLSMADHFNDSFALTPALMAAADATSSLRIGAMVFANDFRHPAVLTREAATLDVLSNGRLELGLGAGWQFTDYEQSGIPLDTPGVRIARLSEAVRIVKGLMAEGPLEFDGDHYSIQGLNGLPKPIQSPHPPILIGGGGRKVLTLAAREADIIGLNPKLPAGVIDHRAGPDATAEATHRKLAWIREAAGDRLADIELQTRVHITAITDDVDGFAEAMAPALGVTPDQAKMSPHALGGSVSYIAERILEIREEFGISYFTWGGDALHELAPVVAQLTSE